MILAALLFTVNAGPLTAALHELSIASSPAASSLAAVTTVPAGEQVAPSSSLPGAAPSEDDRLHGELQAEIARTTAQADLLDAMVTSLALYGAGTAGDLWSTEYALHKHPECNDPTLVAGTPCVYEGNPAGFTPTARVALKVGGTAAAAFFEYKLRKSGKKGVANGLRWGFVAVHAMLIAWNVNQANREPNGTVR